MSVRGDKAKELFKSGYNCAQAVLVAFCDKTGFDEETAKKVAAGFGGGMGRLREVCGTFSGAVMALDMIVSDRLNKAELYSDIQMLAEKFKAENGSIICRDLLGLRKEEKSAPEPSPRTEQYYKARPCADLVKYSTELLEEYLNEKGL